MNVNISPHGSINNSTSFGPMTTNNDELSIGFANTKGTPATQIERLIELDLAKTGDGGNSDEKGEGFLSANDFSAAAMDTDIDHRMNHPIKVEQNVLDADENSIVSMLGDANMLALEGDKDKDCLGNAPEGWCLPQLPLKYSVGKVTMHVFHNTRKIVFDAWFHWKRTNCNLKRL